jgi:hypothetical protein
MGTPALEPMRGKGIVLVELGYAEANGCDGVLGRTG